MCVGRVLSPATLMATGPPSRIQRQGSGVLSCERRDCQGSFYKVCLLDFRCYSNYTLRFSHSAALQQLHH